MKNKKRSLKNYTPPTHFPRINKREKAITAALQSVLGFIPRFSFLFIMVFFLEIPDIYAQTQQDTTENEVKKGWTFGALPAIAYDSDVGFKYGGLVNIYNYGDGSNYPDYLQSIYLEWSRTTKSSGINQLLFDSEPLMPELPFRITMDLSYFTERSMDFYGFNGYESIYIPEFSTVGTPDYITKMFYRYERKLFHFSLFLQNNIGNSNFNWLVGYDHYNHKLGRFDFEEYNKKSSDNTLNDTATLYDKYIEWGIIPGKEANGGIINYLKTGIIYDTRDQKANPMEGMWSEVMLSAAPEIMGNRENQFLKLAFIHRHYFTIIPRDLNLALRVGYQGTIAGKAPFYMQSYLISSYTESVNVEGLGGKKSLRGILRNRILGDDILYNNIELRWKFWRLNMFKQHFYLALSGFLDNGLVVDPIDFSKENVPDTFHERDIFDGMTHGIHSSAGAGLHIAMNNNFVLAIDYGKALDKRDGNDGIYIGLNFLY